VIEIIITLSEPGRHRHSFILKIFAKLDWL